MWGTRDKYTRTHTQKKEEKPGGKTAACVPHRVGNCATTAAGRNRSKDRRALHSLGFVCTPYIYMAYPLHARASPAKVIWPKRAKRGWKNNSQSQSGKQNWRKQKNITNGSKDIKSGSKNIGPKERKERKDQAGEEKSMMLPSGFGIRNNAKTR